MNDEQLREIEERCEKATPGPWQVQVNQPPDWGSSVFEIATHIEPAITIGRECWADGEGPNGSNPAVDDCGYFQPDGREDVPGYKIENARFIASARTDIPALLEEVRRLRAWLADARKYGDSDVSARQRGTLPQSLIDAALRGDSAPEVTP